MASVVRRKANAFVGPAVTVLAAGDSFGDASTVSAKKTARRHASLISDTEVTLLVVPRAALSSSAGAAREAKLLEWLREVPALRSCTQATLSTLLRGARRRTCTIGETVVRGHTHGNELHLLYSGELTLSVLSRSTDHCSAEMQVRKMGCGQVVPCELSPLGLSEGVSFACTARASSSHAVVLSLDCRVLSLVLGKQDSGRGLAELISHLVSDARRLAKAAAAHGESWQMMHAFRQGAGMPPSHGESADGSAHPQRLLIATRATMHMPHMLREPHGSATPRRPHSARAAPKTAPKVAHSSKQHRPKPCPHMTASSLIRRVLRRDLLTLTSRLAVDTSPPNPDLPRLPEPRPS